MTIDLSQTAVGRGVYTVRETSRLAGVSPRRIRGWIEGYKRNATPVVHGDYRESDNLLQLSFADLLEVRMIDGFRQLGVPWKVIHRAVDSAAEILEVTHPFIHRKFLTDGRELFLLLQDGLKNKQLIELTKKQHVFHSFVSPYLRGIVFDKSDHPMSWRPLGNRSLVVVDPSRSFGRPIGNDSGIPTEILASLAESTSVRDVANWYEISAKEVRHALVFEQSRAA